MRSSHRFWMWNEFGQNRWALRSPILGRGLWTKDKWFDPVFDPPQLSSIDAWGFCTCKSIHGLRKFWWLLDDSWFSRAIRVLVPRKRFSRFDCPNESLFTLFMFFFRSGELNMRFCDFYPFQVSMFYIALIMSSTSCYWNPVSYCPLLRRTTLSSAKFCNLLLHGIGWKINSQVSIMGWIELNLEYELHGICVFCSVQDLLAFCTEIMLPIVYSNN